MNSKIQNLRKNTRKKVQKKVQKNISSGPRSVFAEKVRAVVRKIPMGSTLTYKEVARRAGKPGASRAVGTVMSANYDKDVPCHRVIRSDGGMGGYNRGGVSKKREILEREKALAKKGKK